MIRNAKLINSDNELIDMFRKGDIRGFNEIVRKYQRQVYRIVRKMVNNHDDTDDITQEVFIKTYHALKDFREESNLFTWIYRIAINSSLNHLKKAKRNNTISIEMIEHDIISSDKNAEDILDDNIQRQHLQKAIENLPPQQKAVFNLRYYEKLSYEDISDIMNRSVGGIKANYFHAIKNIGESMKHKSISIK